MLPVLARVKRLFDLSADPNEIAAHLGTLATRHPGLRVPGAFDGFEVGVRAILGQQVSVKAARTLAGRLIEAFGEKIEDGCEYVRGERRGRFQGGADIPAMDGEFKEASVSQGVRGDNAERMIAWLVPLVRTEGGDEMKEGLPGGAEHGHEVVTKTLAERELLLSHFPPSLPPLLL